MRTLEKNQDGLDQLVWSENGSKYLDVKLEVFKKIDYKDFRPVQLHTLGETDFNLFMRLKIELANAVENYCRKKNFSPVLTPTMSKDMDEQLTIAQNMVDVVDRPLKRICFTLLRYSVDKPEKSYAQVRLFARKKRSKIFDQLSLGTINLKKISIYLM